MPVDSGLSIDITDARLNRHFGGRAWFIGDPRIVYVVRRVENDEPLIQRYLYRNLNRRGLCIPFTRQFHVDTRMEYRCFYTNAAIYLTAGRLLGDPAGMQSRNWRVLPWALTREHVVPRRERDLTRINCLGNMVPCANFLNKLATHMPLIMKLFERDHLREIPFDREAMTFDTAWYVRSKVIEFEQPYWFVDNYPWFPHAIKDARARAAAEEFCAYLYSFEDRFLRLPLREQQAYLRRPCEVDVRAAMKSFLGLTVIG